VITGFPTDTGGLEPSGFAFGVQMNYRFFVFTITRIQRSGLGDEIAF
jgi:hypothetical protein